MSLNDRVALITGGARGIGRSIAGRLANDGAAVALVDIDKDGAEKSAQELEALGVKTAGYSCDVSDPEQVKAIVNEVVSEFGSLSILVNNAGITRDSLIMRMKPEDWDLVLAVNLKGAFNFIHSACRPLMKSGHGAIVNIASVVGLMGNPGQANYSASKAGLLGLTKTAAKEFASRHLRVNAVAPGFIETQMTEKLPEDIKKVWLDTIPLGRGGTMDDIASAVSFLVGPDSEYITGQVLQVDGGMIM